MNFLFSSSNNNEALSRRLKLLRQHWGLPQPIFAQRIGVPARSYQRYESGSQEIPVKVLLEIADQFATPIEWIFRGDQEALDQKVRSTRLDNLMQDGIKTKNDLEFINVLNSDAYTTAAEKKKSVNAEWLANYVRACALLVSKPENIKEILPALYEIIPAIPELKPSQINLPNLVADIESAAKDILNSENGVISAALAKPYTDASLVVFLRGNFHLEEKEIEEFKKLYQPWALMVAKRALQKDKPGLVSDINILTSEYEHPDNDAVKLETKHIFAEGLFSKVNKTGGYIVKKDFSCGLHFNMEKRQIVIGCDLESFMELLEVVELLERQPSGRIGRWELRNEPAFSAQTINKDGVLIPLTREEMEELTSLVRMMGENIKIKREVQMAKAIKYGVI